MASSCQSNKLRLTAFNSFSTFAKVIKGNKLHSRSFSRSSLGQLACAIDPDALYSELNRPASDGENVCNILHWLNHHLESFLGVQVKKNMEPNKTTFSILVLLNVPLTPSAQYSMKPAVP